ncbi:secretin N-terminal domain-containing protein [Terasakiella pusilla]|uniref:secretin N-terminal domain-containing protein n=1 Tax=Terasakiella pusilla TaxID=64973 RepID=UPI003AA9C9D1
MKSSLRNSFTVVGMSVLLASCSGSWDPWKMDGSSYDRVFTEMQEKTNEDQAREQAKAEQEAKNAESEPPVRESDDFYVGEVANAELYAGLGTEPKKLSFRFSNARISDVAAAVIGEVLQQPFVISPDVTGRIDLSAGGTMSEVELVKLLRERLSVSGVVLDRSDDVFIVNVKDSLVPLGEQMKAFSVIPIVNTEPENVARLLQQAFPGITKVTVDADRGLLFVWGPKDSRQRVIESAKYFDTNMLTGRRLMVVPLNHTEAGRMMAELAQIYPQGQAGSAINYAPLPRLNAILLTGRSEQMIQKLRQIVRDLDRPAHKGRGLYVIELQNAEAGVIADQLNQLGWGGTRAAPAEGDGGQSAPQVDSTVVAVPSKHANSLLIRATLEDYQEIYEAVQKLDSKPIQIMIEATIIEVSLNDRLQFGVQSLFEGLADGKVSLGFSNATTGAVGATYPGFNAILNNTGNVQSVINALRAVTDIRVLSRPKLIVANNHEASLQVGDEVPVTVREVQDTTNPNAPTVTSVEYQPTGVILKVTPYANKSGKVTLNITQEVSRVSSLSNTSSLTPTLSKRIIDTQIDVKSGQTAVLGGLISEQDTVTNNRLPILGDLPLIGPLFGSSDRLNSSTELVVFLNPRVFTTEQEGQDITDELMDTLRTIWKEREG